MYHALDLNPHFQDFNFSSRFDGAMGKGPSRLDLIELVHKGRKGNKSSLDEFADTMYCTLRRAAFEAYQHHEGPVAITYEEWFTAKLFQFLQILLYETVQTNALIENKLVWEDTDLPLKKRFTFIDFNGECIQPDEIERTFLPEDNDTGAWWELAKAVSKQGRDRLEAAQAWLKAFREERRSAASSRSGWGKNNERDQIIRNCLNREMARDEVCRELDKLTVPTLAALQSRGHHKWADGWKDPEGKKAIQQLFSKVLRR